MQAYHINQRIDIDEFNYWNWEDKERAKLRKEMLVQSKLEHHSVIGS